MLDSFGRNINYLRLSVTDRCDLRCQYCMPKKTEFYPKSDFLSLEDLKKISFSLFDVGINKIRITGGEPLIRKDIMKFLQFLSLQKKRKRIKEILLTTNGTQLNKNSSEISDLGIKRINVSLDSLIPQKYSFITNGGSLTKVLNGIFQAKNSGIKIKINVVLLKNFNEDEIISFVKWGAKNNFIISFIEVMPIGELNISRKNQYLSVETAKNIIKESYDFFPANHQTNGPSRYFKIKELESLIGFISPISNHFCNSCNRIRITSSGILYGCLGHETSVDLKPYLKNKKFNSLKEIIKETIFNKPEKHFFKIEDKSSFGRFMNTTGG